MVLVVQVGASGRNFVLLRFDHDLRFYFFFQAEDGIRDRDVTGVQTCALPICSKSGGCGRPPASFGDRRHSSALSRLPSAWTSSLLRTSSRGASVPKRARRSWTTSSHALAVGLW